MDELIETTSAPVPTQQNVSSPPEEAPEPDSNLAEDDAGAEQEPALEEVAYQGKNYKLPKELSSVIAKAENLEAGYTRKFQETAEQRKGVEAEREAFVREQQFNAALTKESYQLQNIQERLDQYSKVDWQQWQATNPQAANAAMAEMVTLQNQHGQLRGQFEARRTELATHQQQQNATLVRQAMEVLNKPDPENGWSGKFDETERASLTKFALSRGYTQTQLERTASPVDIKTLNLARIGYESLQKQKAAATAPKPAAEPVPTIAAGTSRASPRDPNKMSMSEFTKWREESIRKRGGR